MLKIWLIVKTYTGIVVADNIAPQLLFEKNYDSEIYCLKWYELAAEGSGRLPCLAICMADKLDIEFIPVLG